MASDTPRPSAFEHGGAFAFLCRADLVKCYKDDGNRLSKHPVATAIPPKGPDDPCCLRVLQWNINCLCGAGGFTDAMSAHGIADRVADQVLSHSPDVVVFNEFGSVAGCLDLKLPTQFGRSGGILALQQRLEQRGYAFHVAECSFPSAIATRLPVEHVGTFPLDDTRAAVHVTVRPDQNGADAATAVTVYATHLDHKDGEQHSRFAPNGGCARPAEATELLRRVGMATAPAQAPASRVLVVGDFNQQRRLDYTPAEWKLICASKKRRGCAETDGVADLMAEAGFVCAFDAGGDRVTSRSGIGGDSSGSGDGAAGATAGDAGPLCEGGGFEQRRGGGDTVAQNWAPGAPPPATHWTGTAIDFTFARGPVVPRGVFIVPSNLSDHRPVITDWVVA